MRPWVQEDDIIEITDGNVAKYFYVQRLEDIIYDYKDYSTVATVTKNDFKEISDLEPKSVTEPEERIYQFRSGIDIGMAYVEVQTGTARRGLHKVPKATSSNYYVGYFTEVTSPFEYPTFEFFLRYTEKPAFSIYNPWGFTITPYLSFRGKHIQAYDLEHNDTPKYITLSRADIMSMMPELKKNRMKHRHVTVGGIIGGV